MEKLNSDFEYIEYTQNEIVNAVKTCVNGLHPKIKPTKTLTNMVYYILKSYFIDKKRFVIANCPTGSGKTIIGFMVHFCIQYLQKHKVRPSVETTEPTSYFLTSNKILQDQIENDIKRFEFENYLTMLKGIDNYPCIIQTQLFNTDNNYKESILRVQPDAKFASYRFRLKCKNKKLSEIEQTFECYPECKYRLLRQEASNASCTILNYAYYLNVFRNKDFENPNRHFYPRLLTICDEAHLLPEIITSFFNNEFTNYSISRIFKLIQEIQQNFGYKDSLDDYLFVINKCLDFFKSTVNQPSQFIYFGNDLKKLVEILKSVNKEYSTNSESYKQMYQSRLSELIDSIDLEDNFEYISKLVNDRIEDVFFTSEKSEGTYYYKHIIKDLREQDMCRKHFVETTNYGLYMSATLGDMDEYAELLGLKENEYKTLYLPSTFNFDKSPIYLCKSGYLNYNNFNNNIDKILLDTIKVCNLHSNEKGVIHTSTFKITELLKEKINSVGNAIDSTRFLFYKNTSEKEKQIELFKNSLKHYILVGPSLYEGIDLPDEKCRFQIMVKVPYSQMSDYVKAKMKRIPFWYKRNCLEKIIQAIGRSNRHENDYSKIYLMDSCFDGVIFDTNDEIINRIENKRIY